MPPGHRKDWAKFAARSESAHGKAAALNLARFELPIAARAQEFDHDNWLLNLGNGTLELRTRTLRPHRPSDLLLKLAPVNYEPAAACSVANLRPRSSLRRIAPSIGA